MPDRTTLAAIDLGATSGRVIVGRFSPKGGLDLTEVHRFPNAFHEFAGHAYWDFGGLFTELKKGLAEAKKLFPDLVSCGVDTWGCDHLLVNGAGRPVFPLHSYRDTRTQPILDRLRADGDDRRLYQWTGLPIINYNTCIQLAETLSAFPAVRDMASRVLFLSDYVNFLLTGKMVNEFSFASTTQMLDVNGEDWSQETLDFFGIPRAWLSTPTKAGKRLGPLQDVPGTDGLEAVLVAGHDTSSAFEAIPTEPGDFIISSGTWNLCGAIGESPILGEEAFAYGVSNERCGDGRYRPCKILIGLWVLEQTLATFDTRPKSAAEWDALITAAEERPAPDVLLDTEDRARFFNPRDMKAAIDEQIVARGGQVPRTLTDYVRLICDSLALSIAAAVKKFEALTGDRYKRMVIVGGGSKNRLLCQRTADCTRLPVISFSLEATSVGNMGYQLLGLGEVPSMTAFHNAILPELTKHTYQPA